MVLVELELLLSMVHKACTDDILKREKSLVLQNKMAIQEREASNPFDSDHSYIVTAARLPGWRTIYTVSMKY